MLICTLEVQYNVRNCNVILCLELGVSLKEKCIRSGNSSGNALEGTQFVYGLGYRIYVLFSCLMYLGQRRSTLIGCKITPSRSSFYHHIHNFSIVFDVM